MITRDLWKLSHPDAPIAASYGTKARCEDWRDRQTWRPAGSHKLERVDSCQCCGAAHVPSEAASLTTWGNGQTRCAKHHDRNPCAIEGCARTTSADGHLASDQWLCGEHWRRFVPPRSLRRRAYHAFFRQAKRHGWTPELRRQFWRFWDTLVANARAKATGGYIDEQAINRLFGWEEAA